MPFSRDDYEMLMLADKSVRSGFLRLLAARFLGESAAFLLLAIDYKENTTHAKAKFITQWYINPEGGKQEFASSYDPYDLQNNLWSQPVNLPVLTAELLNVKRTANYISDRRFYPGLFDPFVDTVVALLTTQNPPVEINARGKPPQISAAWERNLITFSQAVKVVGFDPEECGIY